MNGLCHFEIPAVDMERARKFYQEVFGWESQAFEESYAIIKTPDGVGGGFTSNRTPVENQGLNLYIEVEDIPKTLGMIKSNGGGEIREKTEIAPDMGYLAVFKDSEGNSVGLWSKD